MTMDIGVKREWLKQLIRDDLAQEPLTHEKVKHPAKPKSKLQAHLQAMWEEWRTADSPDVLDSYYEDNELKEYHHYKLDELISEIAKKLGIEKPTYIEYYPEESRKTSYGKALYQITEAILEDRKANLETVQTFINDLYPNLCIDFEDFDTEGINEQYNDLIDRAVSEVDSLKPNAEKYKDKIKAIERAERTEIEQIAEDLDKIVILGKDIWELVLYSTLSPYSPKVVINSLEHRANLHFLFVGDIATAKSKVSKIVKMVSPKWVSITKTTEASFEGVATQEGVEEGLLDWANDGVLIVPEFSKVFSEIQILREAMDCETTTIAKRGHRKTIKVNTTLIASCNPIDDFFQNEIQLREQIPFKEGVLSRFDCLIPLTSTKIKNELILEKLNLFGYELSLTDLTEYREQLKTLSSGMTQIKRVTITDEHQKSLKEAYKLHNRIELSLRPLLILRDLETLARLVNVIATINFPRRKVENGTLQAEDDDIEKAIQLWENLIRFRLQLYRESHREIVSIADEIIKAVFNRGGKEVSLLEICSDIVDSKKMISKATFYREIQSLVREGKLHRNGKKNSTVSLIVS